MWRTNLGCAKEELETRIIYEKIMIKNITIYKNEDEHIHSYAFLSVLLQRRLPRHTSWNSLLILQITS